MHTLFEEAGKYLAGRILSESDASLQVELDSGKRVKVKAANALLKFEKPAPAELMARGQLLSLEIDLVIRSCAFSIREKSQCFACSKFNNFVGC